MSAVVRQCRSPEQQAEHDAKLAALAVAFLRLPERRRARCAQPVTGDPLVDTLVFAEAGDGSAWYEGVVVAGERDGDGAWDLGAQFTIITTDVVPEGELLLVHGYNCDMEVL